MTRKKSIAGNLAFVLGAMAGTFGASRPLDACTTILVGKALTADGSILHAHNEDMGNEAVGRLSWVEAAEHPAGQSLRVPYVDLAQVGRTFGYWAAGNALGATGLGTSQEIRSHDSVLVGLNENGVSLSCNWAHSREDNREGVGLRRYAIRQLLLERARSARHGVELLGDWIETHGQADWGGLVYHLADPQEAWVVETTTRNWVARRLGDDQIHVTANRFGIGSDYDLASRNLVTDALAEGWIDTARGKLDFARVYGKPGKMDQAYDTRREDRARELLRPKQGRITPEDLFAVLADRYEGTEDYTPPQQDPVWRENLDARPELSRTISTNLAQSTFVAHLRGDHPVSVGALLWLGLATPSYAAYLPLYAGGGSLPEAYSSQALEDTDASAWWLFRRLQRMADPDYQRHYPAIRAFWAKRHRDVAERQRAVEARAQTLLRDGKPRVANGILAGLTQAYAAKTLCDVRELLASLSAPVDLAVSAVPSATANQQIVDRGEGKDQWWKALPRAAWSEFSRIEQSQDWFEVYEIRPGIFAIYEPGQFEEVISYLIEGSERALLLDTGLGIGDMRRLASELTDKEILVVNSHTHYDHVGGNHAFETVYGTALGYTRDNALGRAHEEVAEFVGPGWIWKETPAGFASKGYVSRPFTLSRTLEDGQILDLGGGVELEVLLTPGHAPDSLCLLDRERRLLFTGDTFYPATLYAHLPGSTFEDYEATAGRLAELAASVDTVLPAHNEPTMPASELIRLRDAFSAIQHGDPPFVRTDGNREYDFGRFSILVSDPPPWEGDRSGPGGN